VAARRTSAAAGTIRDPVRQEVALREVEGRGEDGREPDVEDATEDAKDEREEPDVEEGESDASASEHQAAPDARIR